MRASWTSPRALATALRAPLCALAIAAALPGCIVVHDDDWDDWDHDDHHDDDDDDWLDAPATVAIDDGAVIGGVTPGEGAGVFVEVDGDAWHLWTTCDSLVSGWPCDFELYVEAEGLRLEDLEELERDDDIDEDRDALDLWLLTDDDVDGVWFRAAQGAEVTLTVYLDGASQPEFVYWIGGGILNEGAPTNPIVFAPR